MKKLKALCLMAVFAISFVSHGTNIIDLEENVTISVEKKNIKRPGKG